MLELQTLNNFHIFTALEVSKYGVFSGPFARIWTEYGKYGPENSLHLDTFGAMFGCLYCLER